MSISDIDKRAAKTALVYSLVSAFCAVFGAVYEVFAHGVYSGFMIYAFAFPLTLGVIPFILMAVFPCRKYPGVTARILYHCGIATLTLGSIVRGILVIYGTTNSLDMLYPIAGMTLLAFALVLYLLPKKEK